MNLRSEPTCHVIRVAAQGAPILRAVSVLERETPAMMTAVRRALPFLTRRGQVFGAPTVRATSLPEDLAALAGPTFVLELSIEPGGSRGIFAMDAGAAALVLDGVLGGNGTSLPTLDPAGLSAAQRALITRTAGDFLSSLTEALGPALGLSLRAAPYTGKDRPDEGTPIVCTFQLEVGDLKATLLLALAKDAVLSRSTAAPATAPPKVNSHVAATLENVEIEIVAELGTDLKRLAEVTNLRVGDTLRLDAPVREYVKVRVGDHASFAGQPTAVGGQVAIRFVRWHDDWKR